MNYKKSGMDDRLVTFKARRTYLVDKGAWKDGNSGCPDFLRNKKNSVIAVRGE